MTSPRDLALALKAKRYGAKYALRIILEARKHPEVPVSLALALVEQESGFSNVFGHDPTIYVGAGAVTKRKYAAYKLARGTTCMQGVGPCQLTWYDFQDRADALGGCWVPRHNIAVGLDILAANIRQSGKCRGVARYNGTGVAADRYAREVLAKQAVWHKRLG